MITDNRIIVDNKILYHEQQAAAAGVYSSIEVSEDLLGWCVR